MRIRCKYLLLFIIIISISTREVTGQVAITPDSSIPDSTAMLEIKSTGKGLLLPRIDFINRPLTPATGLLIYVIANGPFGNGLYLFDGDEWLLIGTNGYYLGMHIGGGVVFNVDSTGQHGLIAAPEDLGWAKWGCDSILIGPAAEHTAIGTGDTNTAAIVAGCTQSDFAAKICESSTLNGFSDWFLPSRDEADSVFVHADMIGGFDPGWYYWSSTEYDDFEAYCKINQPALINYEVTVKKHYNIKIRCIRKF